MLAHAFLAALAALEGAGLAGLARGALDGPGQSLLEASLDQLGVLARGIWVLVSWVLFLFLARLALVPWVRVLGDLWSPCKLLGRPRHFLVLRLESLELGHQFSGVGQVVGDIKYWRRQFAPELAAPDL